MNDLLKRIADFIPTVHGWCSVEKAQWLARRIIENKYHEVVEIGVFGGGSFIPMAMAMEYQRRDESFPTGHVIGIDPYSNDTAETNDLDEVNKKWWKEVDLKGVYKSMQEALARSGAEKFATLLLLQSKDAVEKFDDLSLDLVHVDGSHNEEESSRDVKIWWPKLKIGGVMVMDDTNWKQLVVARKLVGTLGKLIHNTDTWEAYQK